MIDTNGKTLTEKDIKRALKISMVAGFLGWGWLAVSGGPPVALLIDFLSDSGLILGLAVMLQQISFAAQIPATLFFDGLYSKKPLWGLLLIFQRLSWFVPAFVPLIFPSDPEFAALIFVCMIGISSVIGQGCTPVWLNWMASLIPAKIRGRHWSLRQGVLFLAFIIMTIFSGWILDLFPSPDRSGGTYLGFTIVFSMAAILGTIDIIVHLFVPEPKFDNKPQTGFLEKVFYPLLNKDYLWMTVSISFWYLAMGIVGAFGIIYLRKFLLLSYTDIALLTAAASLGSIVIGLPMGLLTDRAGAKTSAVISMIILPFFAIPWFFVKPGNMFFALPLFGRISVPNAVLLFGIANLISGGLASNIGTCQFHMLSSLIPENRRTMSFAVHWTIVGVLSAAGPVIGGIIMDLDMESLNYIFPTGVKFSYIHILAVLYMAVIFLISLPCMLKVKKRTGEIPLWILLSNIKSGNPLRAVSALYNVYQSAIFIKGEEGEK